MKFNELRGRPGARSRKRRRGIIVTAMSVIVALCTVYVMILPALTLEETPICGLEEHTHNDECYAVIEPEDLSADSEEPDAEVSGEVSSDSAESTEGYAET